jgi:hypothetical protein
MVFCKSKKGQSLGLRYQQLDRISSAQWAALAGKKIFFGHKSVGQNIIEGLEDVMKAKPEVKLGIRETTDPGDFVKPIFAHAPIGNNRAPSSKIVGFQELLEKGLGNVLDIAFFKFCSVDIDHATDIEALFAQYKETIKHLQNEFPRLKILTLTVPLISRPVGIKQRIKKILGLLPWEVEDNIKRNLFNEMLRESFGDMLFDLADYEASGLTGGKSVFSRGGKEFYLLQKVYTDDGGHLNQVGRVYIAIELLKRLVTL